MSANPVSETDSAFVSPAEFAARPDVNVSDETIRRWIGEGRLGDAAHRVGPRLFRINVKAALAALFSDTPHTPPRQ